MRTDTDEKAARQAKMSKALSSAYLSHQISQLQDKVRTTSLDPASKRNGIKAAHVDEAEFPALGAEPVKLKPQQTLGVSLEKEHGERETIGVRAVNGDAGEPREARIDRSDVGSDLFGSGDGRRENGGRRGRGRGGGEGGRGGGRSGGRGGRGNGHGHGHGQGHFRRDHSHGEREDDFDGEFEQGKHWRVVVLDTSALLWAPQGVRRLVRQGWELIVPSEALRVLDLLKSGSFPSARAARSATRFIEHSSRHFKLLPPYQSISISGSTSYKKGRGLRLQLDHDQEYRSPDSVSTLPIPLIDGDVLPKWVDNILGCAAYFMQVAPSDNDAADDESISSFAGTGATLFVANPPLSVETEEGFTGNIGQRGEGYTISQEAERFEIPIEVLRDEEDEIEQERMGKKAHRSRTRALHRPPRGGGRPGRRAEESQDDQPEVKILLRRPVDDQVGVVTVPAPQLSSPSTANPSPLPTAPRLDVAKGSREEDKHAPPPPRSPRRPPHDFAHPPPPPSPGHRGPPPFGHRDPPPNATDLHGHPHHGPPHHGAPHHGPHHHGPPPPEIRGPLPPFDHPPPPPPFGRPPPSPRGFGFDPRRRAYDDSSEDDDPMHRPHDHSHHATRDDDRGGGDHRGGGRGRGEGRGRSGGRGRGRGRGGPRGGGPAPGEFVLLQRPGPPPKEERMGGAGTGPKVVLLQRPKPA